VLNPTELDALARERHQDLLREAAAYRLASAARPPRRSARDRARPAAGRLAVLAAVLAAGAFAVQLGPILARAWPG